MKKVTDQVWKSVETTDYKTYWSLFIYLFIMLFIYNKLNINKSTLNIFCANKFKLRQNRQITTQIFAVSWLNWLKSTEGKNILERFQNSKSEKFSYNVLPAPVDF